MPAEVDEAFRSLQALSESVITFFKKRAELEALYLEGLDKILTKQEESDKRHEALYRDTSLLQAWSQIKAIVYAEIVERRQLLYAIQHSVVEPLVAFKDQKERQRRRIKEETTATANEHSDYKAHTLRLKRTYQRKSEEVRQVSATLNDLVSPPSSQPSGTVSPSAAAIAGTSSLGGSVHPVSSGGGGGGGGSSSDRVLISGATSSSLRDAQSPPPINNPAIAAIKSSRSQLNNLITKLGSAAAGRTSGHTSSLSSGGGGGGDNVIKPSSLVTLKLSKTRREAEESDANYRSALHHLETLRLQRERVSKASLGTLHETCFELSTTCQSIFSQYCDTWASKSRKIEKLWENGRNSAQSIAPHDDLGRFMAHANVDVFYEEPLPYENYHVGVSYSLIFGVSLNEYSSGNDGVLVPLTVQRAILEIDSRGLDTEGIYRIPGKLALIQQVVQSIEQDEITFEFDPDRHDVHTVAGVLKLYLRQLPEPLLPIDAKERETISSATDAEAFKMLNKRLRRISPAHQATIKMLAAHFARVLAHSAANKMSAQALSLCLNPVVFPEEMSLHAVSQGYKDRCLEFLITNRQALFSGLPAQTEGNSPYRNRFNQAGYADDTDEDPPLRRSQEASLGSPPAGSGISMASEASYPVPIRRSLDMPSALPVYDSTAMGRISSNSSMASESSFSSVGHALQASTLPSTMLGLPSQSASSTSVAEPQRPPVTQPSNTTPLLPAAPVVPPSGHCHPKRTLSQRARSSSQSLANAMKNLGRAKSPTLHSPTQSSPASVSSMNPTSPTREIDDLVLQASFGGNATQDTLNPPSFVVAGRSSPQPMSLSATGLGLPAGAAPLLDRHSSYASSASTSAVVTPALPETATADYIMQSTSSPPNNVDPDSIYATYHRETAAAQDKTQDSS